MEIVSFTIQKKDLEHPLKKSSKYSLEKHPIEDSFKHFVNENVGIFAVADGITRDPIKNSYPNPSPAKEVADLFCKIFMKKQSLKFINQQIKKLNQEKNLNPDYLENDLWACVGVGGVIENYKLNYEFIGDCGVAIFDKNGNLKFKTNNEGPNSKGSIDKEIKEKYKTSFSEKKGRELIRSKYRNNPKEKLAYGALTGEKNAEHYIKKAKKNLVNGDYALFYSDGAIPIIFSDKFNIAKEFNSLERYFKKNIEKIGGAEGTLIAVKLE